MSQATELSVQAIHSVKHALLTVSEIAAEAKKPESNPSPSETTYSYGIQG